MTKTAKSAPKSKFGPYEKILLRKAEEVSSAMSASRVSHLVSRQEGPADDGDLSQKSHEEWIFLNRNTIEKKLLDEVMAALRRIEQGAYGTCVECEEPISAKRLDAVPWAKYCVICQEAISQRAAQGYPDDHEETEA